MADLYIWEKYQANGTTNTVGTGRYNWNKYNNIRTYTEENRFGVDGSYDVSALPSGVNSSYSFDRNTGIYSVGGRKTITADEVKNSGLGVTHYSVEDGGKTLRKHVITWNGSNYHYIYGTKSSIESNSRGSFVGTVSGTYSQYTNNIKNSDDYWYVRGSEITTTSTTYSKGSYVGTVTAAYNAYSNNARNSDGYWYVRGGLANKVPTVVLNTENKTLYEADTITIAGTATDADNGNVVTVKYKIAESVEKALTAAVSNGSSAIPFNKQLVFKGGKILDGETALTGALTEGTAYTLQVWAEDNQGGKSAIQSRSFHVVPNRAPSLNINDFDASTCTIDTDTFTISGTCEDADGNTMRVGYRINGGDFTEVYSGADGNWAFDLALGNLQSRQNIITIEAIDSYDFKTTKTIKLNKNTDSTDVLQAVARYTIVPPSGTAKGILVWIQHSEDLTIDGCYLSMTDAVEQENFVEMTHTNVAPLANQPDILESEFVLETQVPKEKIILKVHMSRASVDVNPTIKLISGVME